MLHRSLAAAVAAAALVASVAVPAALGASALPSVTDEAPAVGAATLANAKPTRDAEPTLDAEPTRDAVPVDDLAPVSLSNGFASLPSLAAATTADARRAATGALISGVPVSRQATKKGSGKTAGYECTAGLPAVKGNREFLVLAGHCGNRGEAIYTAWNAGKRTKIGKISGVSKTYDIAAVETTRGVAEKVWAVRSGKNKVITIKGVADAVPGSKVCQHGYRSGTVCGITVQPVTSKQKAAGLVYGKAPAQRMAARPGDSGGLVVDSQGRAVGIVSESTDDGVWMAWVPAKIALSNWGLKVK